MFKFGEESNYFFAGNEKIYNISSRGIEAYIYSQKETDAPEGKAFSELDYTEFSAGNILISA